MISIHDAIARGEMLLQPTTALDINGRKLPITEENLRLDDMTVDQIRKLAHSAIGAMKRENTLVARAFDLPTLVARLDCTMKGEEVLPYELDERPAGIGVATQLLGHEFYDSIEGHYKDTIGHVPIVVMDQGESSDDSLVFQVAGLDDVNDSPCLVRGLPASVREHPNAPQLIERSVSTVELEGDKTYTTIAEGYSAERVRDGDVVNPEVSMVVKPRQGSKARGVHVYLSPEDRASHGKRGTVTASKMNKLLEQDLPQVKEPFAPPIRLRDQDGTVGNMILRVFVLISPNKQAEVIGGAFVIRRELVVHGASNAIAGGIVV